VLFNCELFTKNSVEDKRMRVFLALLAFTIGFQVQANGAVISHVPGDRVPPVVVSPAFGALVAGGTVGANYIDFGVDYSFGGVEGIFDDGDLAFGGVNGLGVINLISDVDGRIVTLGTTNQGLTSYLYAEAGFAGDATLTLTAFDINGVVIASVPNGPPLGTFGRTTFVIDRLGVFDIASFRISGNDTYGVDEVRIETPISAGPPAVPEPASMAVFGLLAISAVATRKRKR
jgi:hypothetical protein